MITQRKPWLLPALVLVPLAMVPQVMSDQTYLLLLLCSVGIYVIAVSGLDLLFGYSGQISLGHAAFYAVGAYTSALLSLKAGFPVWLSLPAGALLAGLVGVVIALPSVKLVHHFLALVTIGFGEIVRLFVMNVEFTGGHTGLLGIPAFKLGPLVLRSKAEYFYLILFCVVLALVAKQRLVHSRVGRALVAIRENPRAAESFGINLVGYKVWVFAISAIYTGLAGGLYAHLVRFISPETFSGGQSVLFLIVLLFGGVASMWGPVIGAVVISLLTESLQALGSAQGLVYGCAILVVLFLLPRGIAGSFNPVNWFTGKEGAVRWVSSK